MKVLIIVFSLLSFNLTAQSVQSDTSAYYISWFDSNNVIQSLEFVSPDGKVILLKNTIITETDTLFCSGDILPIVNNCVSKIVETNIQRINELEEKVSFYETYFGTLTKNKKCLIFIPVEIKPPFKPCSNE